MAGNSFGKSFVITTWGESHGIALGVVLDGCPPGIDLDVDDIQREINRRKPIKNSSISTGRGEPDEVKILSGIFEGKTTGTPISLIVENKDVRSGDYEGVKNKFRPGHADYTYQLKYGVRDYRGGGRSSGRETVCRVMAGAVAKKILNLKFGTEIFGHTLQVGDLKAVSFVKEDIERNEMRCADIDMSKKMIEFVERLGKDEEDSVGAIVEIIVRNPPKGLGEPVFEKLDAELAKAIMSIGAVKGVEFGAGFKVAEMRGSENNDSMKMKDKGEEGDEVEFLSNNAGGILGGISTGEDIIIRLAVKPVPSIKIPGRHDRCLAPRIIPVAEAMVATTLTDYYLQCLNLK